MPSPPEGILFIDVFVLRALAGNLQFFRKVIFKLIQGFTGCNSAGSIKKCCIFAARKTA